MLHLAPFHPVPTPSTTRRIEDYAVIGNCETVALIGRTGSIDWLSMPRFDSGACFAALLGNPEHGRWLIAPARPHYRVTRRYRPSTLILETIFESEEGAVTVIDFMSRRSRVADLVRIVRGDRGTVSMHTELVVRFEYGSVVPWVSRLRDGRLQFVCGPDRLVLDTSVQLSGVDMRTVGEFSVSAGEEVSFVCTWRRSFRPDPEPLKVEETLAGVQEFWEQWSARAKPCGEFCDVAVRSLLTLKALTHWETGGISAAGTTSLPEKIGGSRNWDYRYCWLRDATFTLYALISSGYLEEAQGWRAWLIRAAGGSPDKLQTVYGLAGERRLAEYEADWLPGFEQSAPVRIGNAAAEQLQLDIYGEIIDALFLARKAGLAAEGASWSLECELVAHLESIWEQPDNGIWEVRGERQHFTHSKVMAWVAFDRAVTTIETLGLEGPLERWRSIRDTIHRQVCEQGFDRKRNTFVGYYGGAHLDASLLRIPLVGFLPPDDAKVLGTVAAIEQDLLRGGFVMRYDTATGTDGLPPGEGAFLACSFWLADNYVLQGRHEEARALFRRLIGLRNDVGLLAEEYDPISRCQLGNFPQALSHLALVNTARNLMGAGPAHERSSQPSSGAPSRAPK
jgi:GH15 family glucan-1,4-alpha-glucosidase